MPLFLIAQTQKVYEGAAHSRDLAERLLVRVIGSGETESEADDSQNAEPS